MNIHHLMEKSLFVEAGAFDCYGGWVLDTQHIQNMGSAYLLAHGIGEAVENAVTRVRFPQKGTYRLWVLTRNWVAPWTQEYQPGIFSVKVGENCCDTVFGTASKEWAWQRGDTIEVDNLDTTIEVHDFTGCEGRFAAIFLSMDLDFVPPNDMAELETFRRQMCGKENCLDGGKYDLAVVGGGFAGMACAKMASQNGLRVALIQDRPVLGGNNSSEVRVWLFGKTCFHKFPRLGKIVNTFDQKVSKINGVENRAENYEDERKLSLFENDRNIHLFMGYSLKKAICRENRIQAIEIYNVKTCDYVKITADNFADCTGDGTLGFLSGADYELTICGHMEQSNFWCVDDVGSPQSFPSCPWSIDLHNCNFVGRPIFEGAVQCTDDQAAQRLGNWQWGSGFEVDPIERDEEIRDYNFRAMYGAWDAIKNTDKAMTNYKIVYSAYLSGKRESRRLLGDVILSASDILKGKEYEDGIVGVDFNMDMHRPDYRYYPAYHEGYAFLGLCNDKPFQVSCYMPYRCLYSRNVENLFMAGRDVSVTHDALSPVRIMRTCGLMGEVVGYAAVLCKRYGVTPRGVYETHLDDLLQYMAEE